MYLSPSPPPTIDAALFMFYSVTLYDSTYCCFRVSHVACKFYLHVINSIQKIPHKHLECFLKHYCKRMKLRYTYGCAVLFSQQRGSSFIHEEIKFCYFTDNLSMISYTFAKERLHLILVGRSYQKSWLFMHISLTCKVQPFCGNLHRHPNDVCMAREGRKARMKLCTLYIKELNDFHILFIIKLYFLFQREVISSGGVIKNNSLVL